MYKNTLSTEIKKVIGDYGIVKTVEQLYWQNGTKIGGPTTHYDVCLDKGDGDIVSSYNTMARACEWARNWNEENK